jgi:hypothetical protein
VERTELCAAHCRREAAAFLGSSTFFWSNHFLVVLRDKRIGAFGSWGDTRDGHGSTPRRNEN